LQAFGANRQSPTLREEKQGLAAPQTEVLGALGKLYLAGHDIETWLSDRVPEIEPLPGRRDLQRTAPAARLGGPP